MEVQQVLHMKGGEGKESYAQNSSLQRLGILKVKPILEKSIEELCKLMNPKCMYIADLGCSSGPNTFQQVEEIITCVDQICIQKNHSPPSFQIFLNDLEGNDFNTVFKSLPAFYKKLANLRDQKNSASSSSSCFIAATPGSFYSRLFPNNSLHFLNSSYSLHWLSQVPLNEGKMNISMASAPEVQKVYLDQFEKDFTTFLNLRSEEMVAEGHLLLTMVAKVDEDADDGSDPKQVIGIILNDMANEGLIEESKLDGFNIPIYNPSEEEIRGIINKQDSFKILHLQTFKLKWIDVYKGNNNSDESSSSAMVEIENCGKFVANSIRAIFEDIVASHFGKSIMDELFHRYSIRASDYVNTGKDMVNNVVISLAKN